MTATATQRPGRLDLELVRGDAAEVELSFVNAAGSTVDLSGRAWQLRIAGPGVLLELDDLVDTAAAAAGELSFALTEAHTALVGPSTTWYLRDNTNDRTLLDGELRAAVAGHAGAPGSRTISATATITNGSAEVTVTALVAAPGILVLEHDEAAPDGYVGLIARRPA